MLCRWRVGWKACRVIPMKYPKIYIRICRVVLVVMLVHVLGAVLINWAYNIITDIRVSDPLGQFAHIFFYVPVWIGLEIYRQVLRFLSSKKWQIRLGSVIVIAVILMMNVILVCVNLRYLELLGFFPFLGALLTSLFFDCAYYIPSILGAYLISWFLKFV